MWTHTTLANRHLYSMAAVAAAGVGVRQQRTLAQTVRVVALSAVMSVLLLLCLASGRMHRGVTSNSTLTISDGEAVARLEDAGDGDAYCNPRASNITDTCSYVRGQCTVDGYIDYLAFHYCTGAPVLTVLLLGVFIVVLFYLVSMVTDEYFVPVLEVITRKMQLSDDLAGVTFLAFGNGAPDIFAAIAAAGQGSSDMMFGAIAGAGMFITTVVIGAVGVAHQFTVRRRPFLRDLIFFAVATIWLWLVLMRGHITLVTSTMMILYYFAYVAVVVIARLVYQRRKAASSVTIVSTERENLIASPETLVPSTSRTSILSPVLSTRDEDMLDLAPEADTLWHEVLPLVFPSHVRHKPITLRQRFLDAIGWPDMSSVDRAMVLVRVPTSLLCNLTCPQYDAAGTWTPGYAGIQLVASTLFCLLGTGAARFVVLGMPLWQIVLVASSLLAFILYLATNVGDDPVLSPLFVSLSFVASVTWIYLIAGELVSVLKALGIILSINRVILGLTVLAWGNSVPDFVANYLVSKSGYPLLALAACFGGPLMNQCLGVGISMVAKTMKQDPFPLALNANTQVLFAGLAISLVSSGVYFPLNRWTSSRRWSWYLFAVYGVFLLISVIVAARQPVQY